MMPSITLNNKNISEPFLEISHLFPLICLLFSVALPQYFIDITESSGTEVSRHQSSFFGAGVTIVDYDHDGLDDIMVPTLQGQAFKVFKNLGDETFIDVSSSIGFGNEDDESINILVADYDNDGFDDVYVVNFSASSRLYHNNGDNTYEDVTIPSGVYTSFQTSRAACWLDYDRDGYIDLYMVNRDREEMNILFHNNGDGTFSNTTDFAGVDGTPEKMGLVVVSFDYDNDRWPDIYIGNDFDVGNIFYRNNGDGTFSDYSIQSGLDLAFSSMGLAVGDYDNDFDMDVYVTNLDWGNALMRKNDDGTFTNVATELGLEVNLICWGATFFDYDNDSDLDLYVAVGCVSGTANNGELGCSWNASTSDPLSHNNVFYTNIGNGAFDDSSQTSGLDNAYLTTGTAIGDINNDGFYDIYEVNELDSDASSSNICRLYKNNIPSTISDQRHWVKIKLEGIHSNKNAIGSRIYVYPDNAAGIMREVMAGEGYSSQSSYTISFGLRNRDIIDSVKVVWPSGLVEYHHNVSVDQTHHFTEGVDSDFSVCLFPVENYDCEGNCTIVVDCSGECGGSAVSGCDDVCGSTAYLDACETCDDDVSNDCVQDCAGFWGGTDYDQGCGCGIYDELPTDGCDDVCGSTAYLDECETCDDDASNDCVQDCAGTWGGGQVDDECGICDGDNSTCTDCNGQINPCGEGSITCDQWSYIDGCTNCVGGNTGLEACATDCNGVDGGTAWFDQCGQCVDAGDTSCVMACNGQYYNDGSGPIVDACGICGGNGCYQQDCETYPSGEYNCDGIVLSLEELLPSEYGLMQNYPNPFNPSTSISFSIPEFAIVSISIYNVNGQKVKSLLQNTMSPGYHQVSWYGDDISGASVPNGIYFYIMETSSFIEKRKMLFLK